MCNILPDFSKNIEPDQNIAIIRTSDGRTHYIPLETYGDTPQAHRNAITLACQYTRELATFDEDGSPVIYGEKDILSPIRIKMAKKIQELVLESYRPILRLESQRLLAAKDPA